jgi:hypothetical protein
VGTSKGQRDGRRPINDDYDKPSKRNSNPAEFEQHKPEMKEMVEQAGQTVKEQVKQSARKVKDETKDAAKRSGSDPRSNA